MYIIHHLQNSRSFRIVWLLNELNVPYELKCYPRVNNKAPPEFKALHPLGKAPILEHNGEMIVESGNIAQYVLRNSGVSIPQQQWMWIMFSEGTLLLHALAITYSRWSLADDQDEDRRALKKCEKFMAGNVQNDMDYIEKSLVGDYLCGEFSVADVMLAFSVEFTIAKDLGVEGRSWERINAWLERLQARPAYIKAKAEAPHEL